MNSFLKFTILLSVSCILTCRANEILSYQEVKEGFNNPENNFFDVREKIELVETGKYPNDPTNIQSKLLIIHAYHVLNFILNFSG